MNKIKDIFSNKTLVTFIAGALFVMLFFRQCNQISNLKEEVKITQQTSDRNFNNYRAAQDSVTVLKNENGDQLAQIRSYEFDLADLEANQKELTTKYRKALSLNKDLKEVNALISAELEIKDNIDVVTNVEEVDTTTTKITFDSSKDFGNGNSRSLTGWSTIRLDNSGLSVLDSEFNLSQSLSLLAAIEKGEDGANVLKLSTSYPGIEIKDIENINLINTKLNQAPKKARWSIGFGVGYGINLNNNQVISTGPSIGVGLYWSPKFLQF